MKKKKHSRRALLHEVAIMKNLAHENVVQMVTVMESKQELFIVLEYVGGGELFDKVSRALRPIDPIPSTLESDTQTLYDTGAACHALDAKLENLKHELWSIGSVLCTPPTAHQPRAKPQTPNPKPKTPNPKSPSLNRCQSGSATRGRG